MSALKPLIRFVLVGWARHGVATEWVARHVAGAPLACRGQDGEAPSRAKQACDDEAGQAYQIAIFSRGASLEA